MDPGLVGQYVLNGLMLGVIYAMVAVGFTLFFGVLDVIKFSHGDVVMVGAFVALAAVGGAQAAGVSAPLVLVMLAALAAALARALQGALI
jgi:branched-chain amino acid transport system permease protein